VARRLVLSFFFQAEDGIRDFHVTGVQTCALPISVLMFTSGPNHGEAIGNLFGEALYHASLAAEEYKQLLNDHGFQVIKMIAEDEIGRASCRERGYRGGVGVARKEDSLT